MLRPLKPKEKIHRLAVDLSPSSVQAVSRIMEVLDSTSHADAIRSAIKIVDTLIRAQSNGSKITIVLPDGTSTLVLIPTLPS